MNFHEGPWMITNICDHGVQQYLWWDWLIIIVDSSLWNITNIREKKFLTTDLHYDSSHTENCVIFVNKLVNILNFGTKTHFMIELTIYLFQLTTVLVDDVVWIYIV